MSLGIFEGIKTDSTVINIVDPYTGGSEHDYFMGYLRSLPYLFECGITRYTFSPGWMHINSHPTFDAVFEEKSGSENEFRYDAVADLAFDYVILAEEAESTKIQYQQLCQYTSQQLDVDSDANTTFKIFQAFNDGHINELFLVTDRADFNLDVTVADKPLIEEVDNVEQLSYERLAQRYIQSNFDKVRLGFDETLNIWLHHAAADYEAVTGSTPDRIADLFEFETLPPGIRTWEFFEFLGSDLSDDEPDHISAVTRPWVESDNSVIETYIRNALQDFNYDPETIQHYRKTGQRPD